MSRRNAAEKRPVLPDPQFNSRLASMIVARLMKHGKKIDSPAHPFGCLLADQ